MPHVTTTSNDYYLRYAPDIEKPEADEADPIDGIIRAMTHHRKKVADREKHAVRALHAKSTGLVTGQLQVAPNLPPHLSQGLFAIPHTFDVAVRFAQGPGETLPDKVSTHRGTAIKAFGVEGKRSRATTKRRTIEITRPLSAIPSDP